MASPRRKRVLGKAGRISTFAHLVSGDKEHRYGASYRRPWWQRADEDPDRYGVNVAMKRLVPVGQ